MVPTIRNPDRFAVISVTGITSHTKAHTNAHANYEIQGSIDFLNIGRSLLMWAGMGRVGERFWALRLLGKMI